ncbi:hypothetical protein GCM10027048_20440 [Hymenobacter coalescens]
MRRSNFEQEQRRAYVNAKQLQFLQARARRRTFVGGRGSGKTTVAGHQTRVEMNFLPRAKFFLAGLTYNQLLTSTLPGMELAWQVHGLREYNPKTKFGHYVIGKTPPAHWYKPYIAPRNYENCVTFLNGYTLQLLSMDRPDAARGGSYDGGHMDESALLKEEHVTRILRPMIRANRYRFKDHYLHWGLSDYTSVPWLPSGQWVFKTEEAAKENPEKAFYLESTARDNVDVLGEEYLTNLRAGMTKLEWDVEVMNVRLAKVPNTFYPDFNAEKHSSWDIFSYEYDEATGITLPTRTFRLPKRPLELSFDFNARFTSVIVCQETDQEFRCLDALAVTQAEANTNVLDALVKAFCDEYESHPTKLLYIYGDRNGNNKQVASNKTLYEQICEQLVERGWAPQLMVHGLDPDHRLKHLMINAMLAERNSRLPRVRMDREKCKYLIVSISQSPMTPDFKKDKRSEANLVDQRLATHFSDCFDNIVYKKYGHLYGIDTQPYQVRFLGRG